MPKQVFALRICLQREDVKILQFFFWKQTAFILSFEVHCKLEKIKKKNDLFDCKGRCWLLLLEVM